MGIKKIFSLGVNRNMLSSRIKDTPYINKTGKVLSVSIVAYVANGTTAYLQNNLNQRFINSNFGSVERQFQFVALVPPNCQYWIGGVTSISNWDEQTLG